MKKPVMSVTKSTKFTSALEIKPTHEPVLDGPEVDQSFIELSEPVAKMSVWVNPKGAFSVDETLACLF